MKKFQKDFPVLVISYFSINIIWSIYLIFKETSRIPRLVYLPNSNVRTNLKPGLYRALNILFARIIGFILPSFKIPGPVLLDPSSYLAICEILTNNYAVTTKSIIKSCSYVPSKVSIDNLSCFYALGLKTKDFFPNSDIYIFNGRFAPQYSYVLGCRDAGLTLFHIEITSDLTSTYIYSCSQSLWSSEKIDPLYEKYRSTDTDYSNFYSLRASGRDVLGLLYKRNEVAAQTYDIVYYPTTPYEFVAFGLDAFRFRDLTGYIISELEYFSNLGYTVAIREHPNFATSSYQDQIYYDSLRQKALQAKICYFDASSTVDSYSLISPKSAVITLGSTIGGEIASLGNLVLECNPFSFTYKLGLTVAYSRELLSMFLLSNYKPPELSQSVLDKFAFINSAYGHRLPVFLDLRVKLDHLRRLFSH